MIVVETEPKVKVVTEAEDRRTTLLAQMASSIAGGWVSDPDAPTKTEEDKRLIAKESATLARYILEELEA